MRRPKQASVKDGFVEFPEEGETIDIAVNRLINNLNPGDVLLLYLENESDIPTGIRYYSAALDEGASVDRLCGIVNKVTQGGLVLLPFGFTDNIESDQKPIPYDEIRAYEIFRPSEAKPLEFIIRTEEDQGCVVFTLIGEADLYKAPQGRASILNAIQEGKRNLILDMSKVVYLDSTFLGVLIGGLKRARDANGDLVFLNPPQNVTRTFKVTRLDKLFKSYQTREEALAHYKK